MISLNQIVAYNSTLSNQIVINKSTLTRSTLTSLRQPDRH